MKQPVKKKNKVELYLERTKLKDKPKPKSNKLLAPLSKVGKKRGTK